MELGASPGFLCTAFYSPAGNPHAITLAFVVLVLSLMLPPLWGTLLREFWLCFCVVGLFMVTSAARSMLKSAYEVVDLLLGLCDGYCLLHQNGTVAFADPTATDLGIEPGKPAFDGNVEGVEGGLKTHWLKTRNGARVQVETYLAGPFGPVEGISRLLAQSLQTRAPELLRAEERRYLCTMRIRESEKAPEDEGKVGKNEIVKMLSGELVGALDQGNSRGQVIRQEFEDYCENSSDLPPLSDVPSVMKQHGDGLPGKSAIPGSHWKAIQAVGLGVGTYKKVRMINRGGQGCVWQVLSEEGIEYAQKDISLKGVLWHVDFPKRLRDADREVRALKGLAWASRVVVPIIDCWITNDFEQACIVMEWLPKNMNEVLKQRRKDKSGPVPVTSACRWLTHIVVGIAAIHSEGFIHRDVKTANILVNEQSDICKIADLGVSRPLHRRHLDQPDCDDSASRISMESEKTKVSKVSVGGMSILSGYTERPGTNAYSSPEALVSGDYDVSADIFSIGCVLLEMLTLEMPPELSHGSTESMVTLLARDMLRSHGAPPGSSSSVRTITADLHKICHEMLCHKASLRPSAKEVALRPFLRESLNLMLDVPRLRQLLFG